tara:strand:- start:522 stop:773 length:252 start_codon:yes stop_codon:yes gene_type:complete
MTKKELKDTIYSLELDLKYLKKELQFQLELNDVEDILERYKDGEHKYAWQAGAFQAMVKGDNRMLERTVETIKKMQEKLGEAK